MKPQPPVTSIRTAPSSSSTQQSQASQERDFTQSPPRSQRLNENEIAKHILDAAFVVHSKIGPGVFESVYEALVAHELTKNGLLVERQKPMSIVYDGIRFDEAFRSDLIVNGKVIAELKSVHALSPVHAKQVLTQLRLTGLKLGLLINFGEAHLKNGIKRIINGQLEGEDLTDLPL